MRESSQEGKRISKPRYVLSGSNLKTVRKEMQRPSAPCVQIKSIRQAVNLILDHIENDRGLESVAIPADKQYYWDMGIDEKFVITDTSPNLTIGKVSDDLEFVSLMVKNAEGDSSQAPGLMLMHVAPVLLMLGSIVKS